MVNVYLFSSVHNFVIAGTDENGENWYMANINQFTVCVKSLLLISVDLQPVTYQEPQYWCSIVYYEPITCTVISVDLQPVTYQEPQYWCSIVYYEPITYMYCYFSGSSACNIPRTAVLVFHRVLWTEQSCGGGVPCLADQHCSGRVHRPL